MLARDKIPYDSCSYIKRDNMHSSEKSLSKLPYKTGQKASYLGVASYVFLIGKSCFYLQIKKGWMKLKVMLTMLA